MNRRNRGSTPIGIIVTVFVFLLVISMSIYLVVQYNISLQESRRASERLTAKANEALELYPIPLGDGRQIDPDAFLVKNVGKNFEAVIVEVLCEDLTTRRLDRYVLSEPIIVRQGKITQVDVGDKFNITDNKVVGVATELGNVFWGFTVRITFSVIPPEEVGTAGMNTTETMLIVDGTSYPVGSLVPGGDVANPSELTFCWAAGSQHSCHWAKEISPSNVTAIAAWNLTEVTGLVSLSDSTSSPDADVESFLFTVPYVDYYIRAKYEYVSTLAATMDVKWVENNDTLLEETEAEFHPLGTDSKEYLLKINFTIDAAASALPAETSFNLSVIGPLTPPPRTRPEAKFNSTGETTQSITFTETSESNVSYVTVSSGTSWWDEQYWGNWEIEVVAVIHSPRGVLTTSETATLKLLKLNKTTLIFKSMFEGDSIEEATPCSCFIKGVDPPDGSPLRFALLPQDWVSEIEVAPGWYNISAKSTKAVEPVGYETSFDHWEILTEPSRTNSSFTLTFEGTNSNPTRTLETNESIAVMTVIAVYKKPYVTNVDLDIALFEVSGAPLFMSEDKNITITVTEELPCAEAEGDVTFTVDKETATAPQRYIGKIYNGTLKITSTLPRIGYYKPISWSLTCSDPARIHVEPSTGDTKSLLSQFSFLNKTDDAPGVLITLHVTYEYSPPEVIFSQTGLGSDAQGTVLSVDGVPYDYSSLPLAFSLSNPEWAAGTTHSFAWYTLPSTVSGKQYAWSSTSGGITTLQSGTFTVPAEGGDIIGNYETQYQLTIIIDPSGGGTTTPPAGEHYITMGNTQNVTVSVEPGYTFDHWDLDGANMGNDTTVSVLMDTSHVLTALIQAPVIYALNITISPPYTGLIIASPPYTDPIYPQSPINYTEGTVVNVTATSSPGAPDYVFDHWELDGVNVGSSNPYTVIMDSDHDLIAHFTGIPTHRLRVYTNGQGSTSPSGTHWYPEGTSVSVSATADAGYSFDHWELDGVDVGSSNPYTVTMDTDHDLTAYFVLPADMWEFSEYFYVAWPGGNDYLTTLGYIDPYVPSRIRDTFVTAHFEYKYPYYTGTSIVWSSWKSRTIDDNQVSLPNSIGAIIKVRNMYYELSGGEMIHILWEGSDSWFLAYDTAAGKCVGSVNDPGTGLPADPPLTIHAISADSNVNLNVSFNLTGRAFWKTPVEILQQTNFSLFEGEYTIYAPEHFKGYKFVCWLNKETGRLLGTQYFITLNITKATDLLVVYKVEEDLNVLVDPAFILLTGLLLIGGLALVHWTKNMRTKWRRKFRKAGFSAIIVALIFLLVISFFTVVLLLIIPQVNLATQEATEAQELLVKKAQENLCVTLYYHQTEGETTLIVQVVNNGTIPVTLTDALFIRGQTGCYPDFPDILIVPKDCWIIAFSNRRWNASGVGDDPPLLTDPKLRLEEGNFQHRHILIPRGYNMIEEMVAFALISRRGNIFAVTL